jgi:hypothetical protein
MLPVIVVDVEWRATAKQVRRFRNLSIVEYLS